MANMVEPDEWIEFKVLGNWARGRPSDATGDGRRALVAADMRRILDHVGPLDVPPDIVDLGVEAVCDFMVDRDDLIVTAAYSRFMRGVLVASRAHPDRVSAAGVQSMLTAALTAPKKIRGSFEFWGNGNYAKLLHEGVFLVNSPASAAFIRALPPGHWAIDPFNLEWACMNARDDGRDENVAALAGRGIRVTRHHVDYFSRGIDRARVLAAVTLISDEQWNKDYNR